MSPNTAIVMLVYYNYELVERSIKSFHSVFDGDIIFIENPSIHSDKMRELAVRYGVSRHFICNENIGGCLIELFLRSYSSLLNKYDFVAITESDFVVQHGAIDETLNILVNNVEIDIVSIQLDITLPKYKKLPIKSWVPTLHRYKNFYLGKTGFQFIMFRCHILYDFLKQLQTKEIVNPIVLGCNNFYGLSDTNLYCYIVKNNKKWGVTNLTGDHIGWEQYLDENGNFSLESDYCNERKKHLYYTRSNQVMDKLHTFSIIEISQR